MWRRPFQPSFQAQMPLPWAAEPPANAIGPFFVAAPAVAGRARAKSAKAIEIRRVMRV